MNPIYKQSKVKHKTFRPMLRAACKMIYILSFTAKTIGFHGRPSIKINLTNSITVFTPWLLRRPQPIHYPATSQIDDTTHETRGCQEKKRNYCKPKFSIKSSKNLRGNFLESFLESPIFDTKYIHETRG